jgi:hypothetical protein
MIIGVVIVKRKTPCSEDKEREAVLWSCLRVVSSHELRTSLMDMTVWVIVITLELPSHLLFNLLPWRVHVVTEWYTGTDLSVAIGFEKCVLASLGNRFVFLFHLSAYKMYSNSSSMQGLRTCLVDCIQSYCLLKSLGPRQRDGHRLFWKNLSSCKIWGFHGGDCKGWRLLGCYAMWLL